MGVREYDCLTGVFVLAVFFVFKANSGSSYVSFCGLVQQ